ncbi:MAG TPA: hypothetical protein VIL26_03975 [Clostridia bacterium]
MKRMRTINEAMREIKELDAGTSVTANGIRILCKQNLIHYALIGKKFLIDLDDLIRYLCGK